MPRRQADLFESTPTPPTARDLRITRQGRKPLGKAQQLFNRLSAKVQKLRDVLAGWSDFETRLRQQVLERLLPVLDEMNRVRRSLILQCADTLAGQVGGGVKSAAERRRLTAFLIELCQAHLSDAEDDEPIIAVHDRYADRAFADVLAEERQWARVVDEVFGDDPEDPFGAGWESDAHADEEPAADEDNRQSSRARRRAEGAAAAEGAVREASESVREVYRKLASALHPDRGADDAERERRHELMQRVNQAYESSDLLGLLTLQLEIEQIDEDHLVTVPERRLQHYNQVLREQVKELEQELAHVYDHIRATIPNAPANPTPAGLDAAFEHAVAEARNELADLRAHAEELLDPSYRRQWLGDYERERKDEEREMRELEAMLLADEDELIDSFVFDHMPGSQQPRRKPKSRRKRR
jgi:hypothetical protein